LPTDNDLTPVPGALQIENTPDRSDWEELLGKIPDHIRPGNLLRAAWLAAERSSQHERIDRLLGTHAITAEVGNQVESILAFQEPMRDLLERIARNTDRITPARAEEMLKDILGSVYNRLCRNATYDLMAAEQVFHHPNFASPGDAIFNIAKAFEVQLKEVVLPLFRRYLTEHGIKMFPREAKLIGGPIVRDAMLSINRPLGHIKEALNCAEPELAEFCQEYGFSLMRLRESIEQVHRYRNMTGHGEALALPKVAELREKWLGVDVRDGGIFQFVITDRFDPWLDRY
jgi:hypothetical protein